jgi:hypothetical protein
MSKHKAALTETSLTADLHDGFMEGFGYWSRNGKYRADDAADNGTFALDVTA